MPPFDGLTNSPGIDLAYRVKQEYAYLRKPGERVPLVLDKLYEMGRLGQKAPTACNNIPTSLGTESYCWPLSSSCTVRASSSISCS